MELINAFWMTLVEVAPYLLLGFLLAGIISQLMPIAWVRRHLGGSGVGASVKAALFGIPLPICSCGVIPLAASLRERGASKAATLSFLVATPQTSVDSVLLCLVLVGPVFAIFSPVAALIAAMVAAGLFALFQRRAAVPVEAPAAEPITTSGGGLLARGRAALAYGFGKMPDDIGKEVLIGLVVAALIAVFLPAGAFSDYLGNGLLGKLVMVAAAVPVYVCSTASVPVVAALIAKGVSPGTAFVFFLAGPATNAATVATVAKVLGRHAVTAYLLGVAGVAIGAGFVMDLYFLNAFANLVGEHAHHEMMAWWQQAAAVVLLGVLLWPTLSRLLRRGKQASCCAATPAPTGGSCCSSKPAAEASSCCSSEPVAEASSCCSTKPAAEASSCCSTKPAAEASSCCSSKPAVEASSCCSSKPATEASSCCSTKPAAEASSCCSTKPAAEASSCCSSKPAAEAASCCATEPADGAASCCSSKPAAKASSTCCGGDEAKPAS